MAEIGNTVWGKREQPSMSYFKCFIPTDHIGEAANKALGEVRVLLREQDFLFSQIQGLYDSLS